MEAILSACPVPPVGFQQIQCAHNLASVPSVFEHYKHPSAAVFSEVETSRKEPRGQVLSGDSRLPRFIFRDRVCKMPAPVEEIEQLNALAEDLNLTIRCQDKAYMASAQSGLTMGSIASRAGNRKL